MSTKKGLNPAQLAGELHSVAIRLLRAVKRTDQVSGLTAPRLSALSVIVFSGSVTLGALAEAEKVRPPTMTRIVNALEQQQLVAKQRDLNDGRLTQIVATMKGKKLLLQGRDRRVRHLSQFIAALKTEERDMLATTLGTLRRLAESLAAD
jgi:DNA-binding MarR family transcriptional regulator